MHPPCQNAPRGFFQMPDTTLSYAGHVTEDDVLEYMQIAHPTYDWFQKFKFMVYAAPVCMGLFLPAKLLFPTVSPNSYLLGTLASLAGVYGLWCFFDWVQKQWGYVLSQGGATGPKN
jgi:hypothetical protein